MNSQLKDISIVDPKVEDISSHGLEFDENEPIRIKITNSLFFPTEL